MIGVFVLFGSVVLETGVQEKFSLRDIPRRFKMKETWECRSGVTLLSVGAPGIQLFIVKD